MFAFLNNKYTRWYNTLINRAQNRTIDPNTYYERHHIFPKCLGGSDVKHNRVMLTFKEHFIAHLCLANMFCEPFAISKMQHAITRMGLKNNKHERNITSGQYTMIKIARRKAQLGKKYSAETRAKMSAAHKGRAKSDEHRANISRARKGVSTGPQSEESRAKKSAALKGRKKSPEHIENVLRAKGYR